MPHFSLQPHSIFLRNEKFSNNKPLMSIRFDFIIRDGEPLFRVQQALTTLPFSSALVVSFVNVSLEQHFET